MLRQISILEPSKQPLRQPLVQPFQPDPSCVLWLLPQRDDKWYDYSGKGNHGVIHGATWKPSRAGVGLDFSASNDYVDCSNNSSLINLTNEATVAAWIFLTPPHSDSYGGLLHHLNGNAARNRILFANSGATKSQVYINGVHIEINSPSVTNNTWNHFVWRYNGSEVVHFVNGVAGTSVAASGNINNGTDALRIGRGYPTLYYFNGTIDDVRIYNRGLRTKEITRIFRVERNWYGV